MLFVSLSTCTSLIAFCSNCLGHLVYTEMTPFRSSVEGQQPFSWGFPSVMRLEEVKDLDLYL